MGWLQYFTAGYFIDVRNCYPTEWDMGNSSDSVFKCTQLTSCLILSVANGSTQSIQKAEESEKIILILLFLIVSVIIIIYALLSGDILRSRNEKAQCGIFWHYWWREREREKDKNNNIRSHQYNSHKHMQWNICCARDSYDITFKTIIIFWVKKSTSVNFNTHDDRVIASFFRDHSNELFMFYHN